LKTKRFDFRFLEYLAFWEQRLTTERLAGLFQVERVHAQRAIVTPYLQAHPGRLERVGRTRRLADGKRPEYGPSTVPDLFDLIETIRTGTGSVGVGVERLDRVLPPLGEHGLRPLYSSGARREAVLVRFETADGVRSGAFSPHHLVRGRSSSHFRGYLSPVDGSRGGYVDIDPYTVIRADEAPGSPFVGSEGDTDWHQFVEVRLRLSDRATLEARSAALREYAGHEGVEAGRLLIPRVRRCLVPHLIQEMRYRIMREGPVEVWVPAPEMESDLRKMA
jgi:hypothetical protein